MRSSPVQDDQGSGSGAKLIDNTELIRFLYQRLSADCQHAIITACMISSVRMVGSKS